MNATCKCWLELRFETQIHSKAGGPGWWFTASGLTVSLLNMVAFEVSRSVAISAFVSSAYPWALARARLKAMTACGQGNRQSGVMNLRRIAMKTG